MFNVDQMYRRIVAPKTFQETGFFDVAKMIMTHVWDIYKDLP